MESLYFEWFSNENWWFPSVHEKEYIDDLIITKFEYLLDYHPPNCVVHKSIKDALSYILLYDQIPRHVFRNQDASHIIQYFLQKALAIVDYYLDDLQNVKSLNCKELSFFLLPLRHTLDPVKINTALSIAWKRLEVCSESDDISTLKRFIKASYLKYPIIDPNILHGNTLNNTVEDFKRILNETFLDKDLTKYDEDKILFSFKNLCNDNSLMPKDIIISISGGVDSMVCSYLLKEFCDLNNINLVAVHINYCNKTTCHEDEAFISWWCSNKLNIPLYVRQIKEINRDQCMKYEFRELYESYTREVRFNSYKSVWNVINKNKNDIPLVVLGHNYNDCFENILTNITHGQKYNNLLGMDDISILDEIKFIRPLIDITKINIRIFAHLYKIPHLHDSTPSWSQRGKIRDKIVPTLNEWNPLLIPGMFKLSHIMSDLNSLMMNIVNDMVTKTNNHNGVFIFEENQNTYHNLMIWKTYFETFYNLKISNKSAKHFYDKFTNWKRDNFKDSVMMTVLNKNLKIKFEKVNKDIYCVKV